MAASASARVVAMVTPLPAASPSALTTIGSFCRGEIRLGAGGVREAAIGRGRNAELGAQILGESLRAFELRRRLLRPEALDSRRREIIYQTGDQRRFRPDDDEIDRVVRAEADDGSMVGDGERDALGDLRNSAVPGRTIELGQQRAGAQLPGERMLAAAGADEEYVHRCLSLES